MFDNLSGRFSRIAKQLKGHARLTEANIASTLREVRMALLEADVAVPVVMEFIERIREQALGQEVVGSLTPGQAALRIVRDELVRLMGDEQASLNFNVAPPAVILLAGLQGVGKTTTVAKLGKWCREKHGKSVLVCSCDVYRPAALAQLQTLAEQNQLEYYPAAVERQPVDIALGALRQARARFTDVLIVDSAGRSQLDVAMMAEISRIHAALAPSDTLFLVDSMMGQEAVNVARAFATELALSGIILTKVDGDARGGAALSVRQVTGQPILFMGVGERSNELSAFHPDRLAARILGMGDMLGLLEEVEQQADPGQAAALAGKIRRGKGFNLEDLRDQLRQLQGLGGLSSLLDKLPGIPKSALASSAVQTQELVRNEAIINSMTPAERRRPALLNGSRKRRIAAGSGTRLQDVNRLLKQFDRMQKMMKKLGGKGNMENLARSLGGKLPPGFNL